MYKLVYAFGWTLTLLPFRALYLLSDLLSFLAFHLSLYRKEVALTNIRRSFPGKTSGEIRKIGREFYRHFLDQVLESFKILHISEKKVLKRFNYKNPELLEELYRTGKSVIATTAHYGLWEWLVSLPLITKYKVLIVYKPPSNKSSEWVYTRFQRLFGGVSVTLPQLPRTLFEYLGRKELTATFILNDQRPIFEHIKYWTTFLNQDTPMQNGLERLAKKTNQAVVFIQIDRRKRGYYDITFHKLFENPAETGPNEITETYLRTLEKIISAKPELWLWTHRRWKIRKSG